MVKVKDIITFMQTIAPPPMALAGDPVGLQVGDPEAEVSKILVVLDPDRLALNAALKNNAQMIISHHPLIFEALSSVDESNPAGALVAEMIRKRINVYSAHTNFDIAANGVSWQLATALGLPLDAAAVLEVTVKEQFLKLVAYLPAENEDEIRSALAAAGAGQIGRYSHCTFVVKGIGTFMPGEGSDPYIGSAGRREKVDEVRLETIIPAGLRAPVIKALLQAHPYEEVAYDLYPLELDGETHGLGLLINSAEPLTIGELVKRCKEKLPYCHPRAYSSSKGPYTRIAILGGSGGSLISQAARSGAEILIAGDFKYHDLKNAEALNLALVDAGHAPTEMPGVFYLAEKLKQMLGEQEGVEVIAQNFAPAGWEIY